MADPTEYSRAWEAHTSSEVNTVYSNRPRCVMEPLAPSLPPTRVRELLYDQEQPDYTSSLLPEDSVNSGLQPEQNWNEVDFILSSERQQRTIMSGLRSWEAAEVSRWAPHEEAGIKSHVTEQQWFRSWQRDRWMAFDIPIANSLDPETVRSLDGRDLGNWDPANDTFWDEWKIILQVAHRKMVLALQSPLYVLALVYVGLCRL